jgi:hypothetical protein
MHTAAMAEKPMGWPLLLDTVFGLCLFIVFGYGAEFLGSTIRS